VPALKRLGLAPGASQSKLSFTPKIEAAVSGADIVQENGPERLDFKQKLYGQLDDLLPAGRDHRVELVRAHDERDSIGLQISIPSVASSAIRSIRPISSHWSKSWVAPRPPKTRSSGPRNSTRALEGGRFECARRCRGCRQSSAGRPCPGSLLSCLPKASSAPPMWIPPCAGDRACVGA